jgi:hypothetical protein
MGVLFANAQLAVKVHAHPFARDPHGQPIATGAPEWGPSYPGSVKRMGMGGQDARNAESYSLRLDPAQWPLEPGDVVTDGVHEYTLTATKLGEIAGYPDAPVNCVHATGLRSTPKVP